MKATKKETNNPRARKKVKYDLTGLTAEEYSAIISGLKLLKEDAEAAKLLKLLEDLEEGAAV